MFTAPLWCLLFGAIIFQSVQDDASDAKEKEIKEKLGKATLKALGLKTPPKPNKELMKKVPQNITDAYNQGQQSESQGDISARTTGNTCSRRDLIIDFEEIYGDNNFVIAPIRINAYQCKGQCLFPLGASMNTTNHVVYQSLLHQVDSTVQAPCCVPTTLQSMTIIYIEGSVIKQRRMSDSKVIGCGCR